MSQAASPVNESIQLATQLHLPDIDKIQLMTQPTSENVDSNQLISQSCKPFDSNQLKNQI